MKETLLDLWTWAQAHGLQALSGMVWPIVTGLAVVLFVPANREDRLALAERNPALRGLLDALRGIGIDPGQVLEGMHLAVFGAPVPSGNVGRLAAFVALCAISGAFAWLARRGVNTAWWPIVSGVLAMLLRKRTPEEWEAMTNSNPRLKGLILVIRGMGLDPARVRDGLVAALSRSAARSSKTPVPVPVEPSAPSEEPADNPSGRPPPDTTAPQRPSSARSGSPPSDPPPSAAIALLGLLLAGTGASALQGCKPPAPDGCEPRAYRCDEHRPWVCSPGQRWTPISEPCATAGAVCCEVIGPSGRRIATCAPADRCLPPTTDAGASDDAATED